MTDQTTKHPGGSLFDRKRVKKPYQCARSRRGRNFEIYRRRKGGEKLNAIAVDYGISSERVRHIVCKFEEYLYWERRNGDANAVKEIEAEIAAS